MGDTNNITQEDQDLLVLTEEKQALLEEQLKGLTPEFFQQKIDEAIGKPELIERLEERGLSVGNLESKKPEMIEALQEKMGGILKILPEMKRSPEDVINETIEKAIQDFPQMINDAIQSEITKSIEAADQRIQKKFGDASNRLGEANNYLENGELPSDPNSELRKEYDAGVISAADTILNMRALGPEAVDSMKEALPKDDFGAQVIELVDQRLAEEAAAAQQQQDVGAPSAIQP